MLPLHQAPNWIVQPALKPKKMMQCAYIGHTGTDK